MSYPHKFFLNFINAMCSVDISVYKVKTVERVTHQTRDVNTMYSNGVKLIFDSLLNL